MARELREGPHNRMERAEEDAPEWLDLAREVLARWESGELYLLHAVAEGLKDAYRRGQSGQEVEAPEPPPAQIIRRTRAPAAPAPTATRVRRTRPV